jgi:hypothetical protein
MHTWRTARVTSQLTSTTARPDRMLMALSLVTARAEAVKEAQEEKLRAATTPGVVLYRADILRME